MVEFAGVLNHNASDEELQENLRNYALFQVFLHKGHLVGSHEDVVAQGTDHLIFILLHQQTLADGFEVNRHLCRYS